MDLYKHNKTGNIYQVLHYGKHTETDEDLVIYTRVMRSDCLTQVWVRPLSQFFEEVEIDGKKLPRFESIVNDHL